AQVAKYIYNQIGTSMWPSSVDADGTMIRNIGIWDAKSDMTMAQVFVNGEVTTGPIRHRILGGLDMARKSYMADWGQSHDLDLVGQEFDPHNPNLGVPSNGYPEFDRVTPLEQRAQAVGGLQDQRYTGLYLQDELGFLEGKIRLTVAGRYTDLSQSAWGGAPDKAKRFTPRVGLSASINKQLSVYGLYDQAFIPQSGTLSNGGKVKPITGNNMEIGVKKDWFGGWNTTLSVYRILKNNELTADPDPNFPATSVDLGQKRSQGVEFDLRGTIVRGLNLIANYAYTDSRIVKSGDGTKIEDGSIVPGFAKHTMNTWLTYKIQDGVLKGVGFSAGYTALLDRATYWEASPDSEHEMDNYFKVDGGVFWEQDNFKIAVNVFNVFDAYLYSGSYASNYFATPVYSYQTEAPRNARLSISYTF
nr:TonB-dependent receptor [Chryseolinea sp.]